MASLTSQHCLSPEQGLQALDETEIAVYLAQLQEWQPDADNESIRREFRFGDFYQTMAFANAVAWIANQQDHHPDMELGYNRCLVRYTTHALNGLSLNDFICAARIDQLHQ